MAQAPANPFLAGLRGRCPRSGKGRLFERYLTLAKVCPDCGLDFQSADPGDGPAVFIMFAVGFIVVPLALVFEIALSPPLWVHMVMWLPLTLALSLALLPIFKATLFALQYTHSAHEGRLDENPPD